MRSPNSRATSYTARLRPSSSVAPAGFEPVGMVYSSRGLLRPSCTSSHPSSTRRRASGKRPLPSLLTPTSLHPMGCRKASEPEYVGDSRRSASSLSSSASKAFASASWLPVVTHTRQSYEPGACSERCSAFRCATNAGNPCVGEYWRASARASASSSTAPPARSSTRILVNGNVAGLGMPPPSEIMPFWASRGWSARIGEGRRARQRCVRYES
mmetsp:Transcript_35193/g.75153  ORF Transcript_35193/g.75153 Transcript_35193/m.75153 type:complete len:213 (+) Transcript_35193:872-1510(+)